MMTRSKDGCQLLSLPPEGFGNVCVCVSVCLSVCVHAFARYAAISSKPFHILAGFRPSALKAALAVSTYCVASLC